MYSRYMLNHGSGSRRGQRIPPELPKDYSGTAFNKNNPGNAETAARTYIMGENTPLANASMPPKAETVTVKRTEPKTERYPELAADIPDPDKFTFPRWDISDGASPALKTMPKMHNLRDYTAGQIKKTNTNIFEPDELLLPIFPESDTEKNDDDYSEKNQINRNEALTENPEVLNISEKPDGRKTEKEQKASGLMHELGGLFKNLDFSSSDILLIALIIYLLNSHADDEMVVILMLLLVIGF